jgi:hypothetical protein
MNQGTKKKQMTVGLHQPKPLAASVRRMWIPKREISGRWKYALHIQVSRRASLAAGN